MEIVELGPLTAGQKRQLEGDEPDPFDAAGVPLHYRPKDQHVALRDERGRLIASTGLLVVDIEVNRHRFAVVGIGGVIVNAQYRGRGLGREIVRAALGKADTLGPAFALLFCHRDRAGLYRKLGFAEITADVSVRQPGGYRRMPQVSMSRGLRGDACWPDGAVVVHSLPF